MLSDLNVGFGITGSFCTFDRIKGHIKNLKNEGANITPVFSFNTQSMDTRFAKASDFIGEIEEITGNKGIYTIQQAETVGPGKLFDVMIIAPCTGNTLAKFTNGITDTPVLMAAKAHMNFQNLGRLMNVKNLYFVPFGQDDCIKKPNSLVAHFDKINDTLENAINNKQIQPVII